MSSETSAVSNRLGHFILENMEPILSSWEDYARRFWQGPMPDIATLRNHAQGMLEALVTDMATSQTDLEQKSKSEGDDGGLSSAMNQAALGHAHARFTDGFDIVRMVAEFRALRASVSQLWWDSVPVPHKEQVADMGRFHESLDQLVAASVTAFTERVEESRRLFLGILGHDMRQPLHSMIMFIEVMSMGKDLPERSTAMLKSMAKCCDGMSNMLGDLLDFTTSQLGHVMSVEVADTDIGEVCQDVVTEVSVANPTREIRISTSGELQGVWDSKRLRQLISNLLSNAIHHGSRTHPIRTSLVSTGDSVMLEVNNFGPPIPPNAMGILFDPMVRLALDGQVRPQGSMGLGLHICRQIVKAHGGEIHLESSEQDGTTFIVNLPKQSPEAATHH